MKKRVLIIAGEVSGDLHGGALMEEMKRDYPEISFIGIGGDKMINAGLEAVYHVNDMAFLGFAEIIRHLPFILKVRAKLLKIVIKENIDDIILIDYPGFNLNIAKKLRKLNKRIIYYISPQVWAWGKNRVKKMKNLVDKMIVIFPFEEDFYKKAGIDVSFVGHPLVNRINSYQFENKEQFFLSNGLDTEKDILLILPGSRKQEIKRILPELVSGANKIANQHSLQIVVACANSINEDFIRSSAPGFNFKIVKGFTYELFKYSKFGIIKSGTSTLEAAYFQLPFIVVYVTSKLTYSIGKRLVNITNIAMANIIAGKTIVPELIQDDVNTDNIYSSIEQYLSDESKLTDLKENLKVVKEKLGQESASKNAATIVGNLLNGN